MITLKNKYNLIVAFPTIIFLLILITHAETSFSQGIGISTVAITPDPSSVLEIRSNSQGVLVPRMTGAARDLIAAPAAGLLIYNTTTLEFNYYQGGWKAITAGGVTSITGSGNIASSGGSTPNLTFTGNLPVTNLNSGTLASATTFWRGDGTWVSPAATNLSGIVPVVNGGTGLSAGISGGILGYTATGTLASSPLLTSKALIIGGGAGFTPTTLSLGTANQMLGMNAAANAHEYKTLSGTANQINLVHGINTITLSTPQNIDLTALPTFAGLTLSGLNANSFLYPNGTKAITSTAAATNGQLLIGSTGAVPVAANLTAGNGIAITNGAGSVTIDNAIPVTEVSSIISFSSTSTNFITATGMSIVVPSSGDYMVWFSTSLTNSNASRIVNVSLFVNNVQVLASERFYEIATANRETPCATQAFIPNAIAGQLIDLRWKVNANTGTMDQRTLTIMRVK
jgi:hypothetical protein